MPVIVIVGGGFAGLWGAMAAARVLDGAAGSAAGIHIALVSPDPRLTIRPRLHEAHPSEEMRVPLRQVLDPIGAELVVATVTGIDTTRRRVRVEGPETKPRDLPFDGLLLAAGSRLHRPAVPGLDHHAWSVDTFDEALALERHLQALRDAPQGPGRFTAVVVGAGFTGIEVAAEMVARLEDLAGGPGSARVVLVERAPVLGPDLGEGPRPVVAEALAALGVETRLGTAVQAVDASGVTLGDGTRIEARTVVWTTGLQASPVTALVAGARDELGRLLVDEHLEVSRPASAGALFAAGDVARAAADAGHSTLMSCQHALTMGACAGGNVARRLLGHPLEPYAPSPYVTCLDLGSWGALFTRGWERTPVETGAAAKTIKRTINTEWIYPPRSGSRRDILVAAGPGGRHAAT